MFHNALKELGFLFGVGIVGLALIFLSGCAARNLDLGFVTLPDGSVIQGIQFTTDGQDGPKLAVIETYRSTVGGTDSFGEPVYHATTKVGEYSAGGSGILSDILAGSARAALYAGGNIGAAAVRRANKTTVTTGAVNTAVSTATGAVNTAIDNAVSANADTTVDTELSSQTQTVVVTDGDLRQRGQGNLNINIGDNTNTTSGRDDD